MTFWMNSINLINQTILLSGRSDYLWKLFNVILYRNSVATFNSSENRRLGFALSLKGPPIANRLHHKAPVPSRLLWSREQNK